MLEPAICPSTHEFLEYPVASPSVRWRRSASGPRRGSANAVDAGAEHHLRIYLASSTLEKFRSVTRIAVEDSGGRRYRVPREMLRSVQDEVQRLASEIVAAGRFDMTFRESK
jgi:hypothetical protein